jgi:Zn-dependent peptidase ImmA (M78 family)
MVSGVVGNNNYRRLDADEFRGFALADDLAPLVFVNGTDSKAAQMFTLAHELAHLWLGRTALSDVGPVAEPTHDIERWCSQVAAELLVPLAVLRAEYEPGGDLRRALDRLARRFKVSRLVILRRIPDARGLTRDQLWQAYQHELQRLGAKPTGSGGNFYLTQSARMGKRFARALVASTLEGDSE